MKYRTTDWVFAVKMTTRYGKNKIDKSVLVGVIKDKRDLGALLTKRWYRIPVLYAPKRKFKYLAFYQPAGFASQGKQILYYARILNQHMARRRDLLPDEPDHPRANDQYFLFRVDKVKKLSRPIRNKIPRRIYFGFTTLGRLRKSQNILELYDVTPTEEMLKGALRRVGIKASRQHYVLSGGKRYYVDFAVFCRYGAIAIECDNKKAHSGARQKKKDEIKNRALKRVGWTVIRLQEENMTRDLRGCMQKVKEAVRELGGIKRSKPE